MNRTIKRARNACVMLAMIGLAAVGLFALSHVGEHNATATGFVPPQVLASAAVGVPASLPQPNGYTTVGAGSVTFGTGTTTLCLAGTAQTSIPCAMVWLSTTGTAATSYVGTGGTSTAGTYTIGNVTASTSAVAAQYPTLAIPCSNVNQIFVTSTGTGSTASYLYFVP